MLRGYFDAGLARGQTYVAAWASYWGVSEKTVKHWAARDEWRAPVSAGDLESLPPEDLAPLLEWWLSEVNARLRPCEPVSDPRLLVLQLAESIGETAKAARKAMADRRCISPEWQDMARRFAQLEHDARDARLACEAAARREGGGR
jgi:hypothetical protein